MNETTNKIEIIKAIETVNRYGNFRVYKLWGIALVIIALFGIWDMLLFENVFFEVTHPEIIYSITASVALLLIIGFFFYFLFQTRKIQIKESKIKSRRTYYASVGLSFILIFYFFCIHIIIIQLICCYVDIDCATNATIAILFGYPIPIPSPLPLHSQVTYVYWGDNLAFLISYFIMRNRIKEYKFREILFSTIFLFLFDPVSYILDAFVFRSNVIGNTIWFIISSAVLALCGIIAIIRAHKTLNKKLDLY